MTATPLFLDSERKLEFTKLSSPVALSDNPEAWQREVASEIFKQLPFLGDYAVNVTIEKVSPERGYGLGWADVSSKSDAPTQEQETLPKVKVPLIIKDRQLQPMDVFLDGETVLPLTETRLHEHLFRTATFETSTRQPQDRGMADQLYPPMRTNYGNNMMSLGEGVMGKFAADKFAGDLQEMAESLNNGKKLTLKEALKKQAEEDPMAYARRLKAEGSAQKFAGPRAKKEKDACGDMPKMASLLEAISHTVPEAEVDAFVDSIKADQVMKVAAIKNPAFRSAIMKIAAFRSQGTEKTAEALVRSIKPNVVQLVKLASGNWQVKWANTEAYRPLEATVGPDQASELTGGGDKIQETSPGGTVTLSTNSAQKTNLDSSKIETIQHFGFWKVWDEGSNSEMYGWVFPIIDLEMHPLPLYIFVEMQGQTYSVQDEIAGTQLQQSADIMDSLRSAMQEASGNGVFVTDGDSPLAVGPFTIASTGAGPGGAQEMSAQDAWGQDVHLIPTPGLNEIQPIDQGTFSIPAELSWVPLRGEPTMLVRSPLDVENTQAAQQNPNTVSVGSTGKGEFNLDGAPVDKLAAADRQFLKKAEAEFLLVGMGVSPFEAREILTQAEKGSLVKVAGVKTITPLSVVHGEMIKRAAAVLGDFPYHLRRNLVKEAAALEDSETADKILALNFINPENISAFADYLPELDDTSSKLAELLMASRLGLDHVDEGAAESAMRNLEEVIEGVKQLHQKQII